LEQLKILHREIAARCQSITAAHSGPWPCHRGCDHCCRHLAHEPLLTRAEWDLLAPHLPADLALDAATTRVCPLLDAATGACRVYPVRPIACRTYGFYVERDAGLYCHIIREQVDQGRMDGTVWGNQVAIDRQLDALGDRQPLSTWLATTGTRPHPSPRPSAQTTPL